MDTLLSPILMIMAGILVGVVVKSFQKYIKIPYTVVLFAIGLLVGYMYKYDILGAGEFLGGGISLVSGMNPDFILYVFLPILVFDAAYEMDLHVFKKTLLNSSILAGPGVVICMLLTAGLLMLLADLTGIYDNSLWKYALMFGGLISATDPIAVVALLKELGTSKRFSTLVDGEALLNDGTGIVCFMLFYSQFNGEGAIDRPVIFFVWVCLASCVIGFVMAKLALWFTTKVCTQETVQNLVMIAAAYITFILAQKTLSVSGVIALVVFGHMFVQSGKTRLKTEVNEFMGKFWGLLTEIANTLIFLIVGIVIATQVNLDFLRQSPMLASQPDYVLYLSVLAFIVIVFVGLNVIRYIMIALLYPVLKRCGYGLSFKECLILGWSGLRGAVAMTLALMVNCNDAIPLEIRGIILLLTAGTITLTLCINATTSKTIVQKLGLDKRFNSAEESAFKRLIASVRESDLEKISEFEKNPSLAGVDWEKVRGRIIPEYNPTFDAEIKSDDVIALLRSYVIELEANQIADEYNRGVILHETYMKLTDTFAVLQDFGGQKGLDELELGYLTKKRLFVSSRRHLSLVFDSCRALTGAFERAGKFLDDVYGFVSLTDLQARNSIFKMLKEELERSTDAVSRIMTSAREKYPVLFSEYLTEMTSKKMLAFERDFIETLISKGILSGESASLLKSSTDLRQGIEIYE